MASKAYDIEYIPKWWEKASLEKKLKNNSKFSLVI